MKRVMIVLVSVLLCGSAEAASIVCSGNYFGYNFTTRATSSGTRVVGRIRLHLTDRSGERTTYRLTPTSSDIRRGEYLRFSGQSSDGSGAISATFTGGNRYSGTLRAQTPRGSATVRVTCTLSGRRAMNTYDLDYDWEEDFEE